ncbi:glycogen synthase GlgA [Inconstantimicrobium mannanitabidum]|uniref:Glycogen synthase n=1 Tax=Inconstantimicrobium mannanitabidum TaxID=1604901 RepID=A0ACB5RGA3_9CLOT|nr:glycogen synthase GlgA [Clostridium sp. TW13]GKX68092.1 glycogen synthase [Clostridium sp. TW13]
MKILFVTAEAYPFMKTGGLGDVAYSLPKSLKNLDVDIRIIMPKYKFEKKVRRRMKKIASFKTYIGWTTVDCSLWSLNFEGIQYYFIDNPYYFYRENAYGYYDDGERFIYFSKAVLEAIKYLENFYPDIIHCNDWHTALAVPLKDVYYGDNEFYSNIKTVFSIHNILYQGIYSPDILWMLGLDKEKYFKEDCLKYYDSVSFMKWGVLSSDVVTTVSKSYAQELTKEYVSYGLSSVFINKKDKLKGILNGLDYDMFNPETDKEIFKNFNINTIQYKLDNKRDLQKQLSLNEDLNIPLISMITRLTDQKGIDLLEAAMYQLMERDIQLVVNGVGNKNYEIMLKHMEEKYKGRFKALIEFKPELSKKVYASSDMFLMPSKFEPCGLGQMIAMRYGTVPIVRSTGGLKDTIQEFNKYSIEGNGFTFQGYSVEDLLTAIDNSLKIFKDKDLWLKLIELDMQADNTWNKSAKEYKKLYFKLIKNKSK